MSSLAKSRVWDGYWEAEAAETWRREADQERKCQKRVATHDAYRVANHQRMAARRTLEWIGMLKAWLVFRYEASDFLSQLLLPFSHQSLTLPPTVLSESSIHNTWCQWCYKLTSRKHLWHISLFWMYNHWSGAERICVVDWTHQFQFQLIDSDNLIVFLTDSRWNWLLPTCLSLPTTTLLPLEEALCTHFKYATHLRCLLHFWRNIESKLSKLG